MARCGCGYNHEGKLVNPCVKHGTKPKIALTKRSTLTLRKGAKK